MKNALCAFLLTLSAISFGQEIALSFGMAKYDHDDLIKVIKSLSQSPLPDITLTTPGTNWYPQVTLTHAITKRFEVGILGEYHSTDFRSRGTNNSDTERIVDQKLNGLLLGILTRFNVYQLQKHTVSLSGIAGASRTWVQIEFFFQDSERTEQSELSFKGTNMTLVSYLNYQYDLHSHLSASLNVGYQVDALKGKLASEEFDGSLLLTDGSNAKANWSGVRTSIGLSYRF